MTQHSVVLTERQRNVLVHLAAEGESAEGYVFDALYYCNPQIRWRGIRHVVKALAAKGLIEIGEWEDEHAGHNLTITDAGKAAVA